MYTIYQALRVSHYPKNEESKVFSSIRVTSTDVTHPQEIVMIRNILATLLFMVTACCVQAQSCNRIYNPQTGETLKVECFASNGQLITNGNVLVGGQTLVLNGGQMNGCTSRFAINIGGRDGSLGFSTCLAQVQQNAAIRAVPVATFPLQNQGLARGSDEASTGQVTRRCIVRGTDYGVRTDAECLSIRQQGGQATERSSTACNHPAVPWKEEGTPPFCAEFSGSTLVRKLPFNPGWQ